MLFLCRDVLEEPTEDELMEKLHQHPHLQLCRWLVGRTDLFRPLFSWGCQLEETEWIFCEMLLGEGLVGQYVRFCLAILCRKVFYFRFISFFEKDLDLANLILSCNFRRSIAAVIFIGCWYQKVLLFFNRESLLKMTVHFKTRTL